MATRDGMVLRRSRVVVSCALWVKECSDALRVVAGAFFLLTLIMGIAWAAGAKVDAVAYVFGLISSLLFSLPQIAELVLPSRKPVRHMGYDELIEFICTTDARRDWNAVHTNWAVDAFLKEDPRLRIRARMDEQGVHIKNYVEPWANKHLHPSATSYWHDLTFDGALIDRFILVSVDGGGAMLPAPQVSSTGVTPIAYKVAEIFDVTNTLDKYMSRSGLSVASGA